MLQAWGTEFFFGSFAAEPLSKRAKAEANVGPYRLQDTFVDTCCCLQSMKRMQHAVLQGQTSGKEVGWLLLLAVVCRSRDV
jgi:hypothetical protein